MVIDRHFKRIADRLRSAELVQRSLDEENWFEDVDEGAPGKRFVDFYSRRGLSRVFAAYGLQRVLEERGLAGYEIHLSGTGPSDHRMQLLLNGIEDDEHRLIDVKVSLERQQLSSFTSRTQRPGSCDIVVVNWLAMQDPVSAAPPNWIPLPGQRYPGLRIGYMMHNMLLLMARRLKREAVVNVPERFHLALVYLRYGYLAVDDGWGDEILAVANDLRAWPLPVVAWAIDRGAVRRPDGEAWSYSPRSVVAPVSRRLRRLTCGTWSALRRRLRPRLSPNVRLDAEVLQEALEARPVPGLDPSSIQRAD